VHLVMEAQHASCHVTDGKLHLMTPTHTSHARAQTIKTHMSACMHTKSEVPGRSQNLPSLTLCWSERLSRFEWLIPASLACPAIDHEHASRSKERSECHRSPLFCHPGRSDDFALQDHPWPICAPGSLYDLEPSVSSACWCEARTYIPTYSAKRQRKHINAARKREWASAHQNLTTILKAAPCPLFTSASPTPAWVRFIVSDWFASPFPGDSEIVPCCLAIFLSFPTGTEFGLSVRETEYHTTGPEVCELGLDCGKEPAVGAADKCAPPCELICTLPPSLRAARV